VGECIANGFLPHMVRFTHPTSTHLRGRFSTQVGKSVTTPMIGRLSRPLVNLAVLYLCVASQHQTRKATTACGRSWVGPPSAAPFGTRIALGLVGQSVEAYSSPVKST